MKVVEVADIVIWRNRVETLCSIRARNFFRAEVLWVCDAL